MPIYEYRCGDCQQLFEEWCKQVEPQEKSRACPICNGESKRIISQTSFALKGGGWYVTEYGSHKQAAKQDAANQSAAQTDGATAGGQASAPASSSGGETDSQNKTATPAPAAKTATPAPKAAAAKEAPAA